MRGTWTCAALLILLNAHLFAGSAATVQTRDAGSVPAQAGSPGTGSIRGTVVDARTAAPLPGVLVECQDSDRFATSAADGTFVLEGLEPGERALFVSVVGFALARPTVVVRGGESTIVTIPLAEGTGAYTERVTVSGSGTSEALIPVPSTHVLTSAGLQDLRGVLADDPFRAVQALPGVATGDDFRAEFSVRGSDFRHMGLSIDGVASRWLVHTVRGVDDTGSVSLINGDVLERITLESGAYPQEFGDRLGAWMATDIREGSRDRLAVRGSLSGTGASAVFEAPIGHQRRGSWLVSARQSYLDWLLRHISDESAIVFGFTDVQAKAAYDVTPRQRAEVTFVAGRSKFTENDSSPGPNSLNVGSSRTGLLTGRLRSTVGDSTVVDQRVAFIGGDFTNRGFFAQTLGRGQVTETSYRLDVAWSPVPSLLVETGARVVRESVRLSRQQYATVSGQGGVAERGRFSFDEPTWRGAWRLGARWRSANGFGLHPGLLVTRHEITGETRLAPWLVATVPVARSVLLRGAASVAHQAPELEHVFGPSGTRTLNAEGARLVDVALDVALGRATSLSVGAYSRRERDVLRLEGAEPRVVAGQTVFPTGQPRYENALSGTGRGIEILLRREAVRGLSGWASYVFGRLRYEDTLSGESFWGDFDQRHTLNLYGSYPLSARTSVSAKLRYGSNFPLVGYFEQHGGSLFAGARRNETRLPAYARLDLRANRTFNYSRRRLTLFVEVLNVLNRTNLGPADGAIRRSGEAVGWFEELLPILPSAGLTVEF